MKRRLCPSRYINNCTGAANLRNFLLFLTWLLAGVAYGLALGLLMGWRDRRALWQHTLRVLQVGFASVCCLVRQPPSCFELLDSWPPQCVFSGSAPDSWPLWCVSSRSIPDSWPPRCVLSRSPPSPPLEWARLSAGHEPHEPCAAHAQLQPDLAAVGAAVAGLLGLFYNGWVPHALATPVCGLGLASPCLPACSAVCWATLVSVGLLFRRQVGLLRQGQTYLDTLSQQQQQQQDEQAAPTAPPAAPTATAAEAPMPSSALATPAALPLPAMLPAMHHVRHVFGGRHPLTWLLPAWEVPPAEAGRRAKVS